MRYFYDILITAIKKGAVMKSKEEFSVRLDGELYKKLLYVARQENNSLNNHMLHMIRANVSYYEKVHGKINTAGISLPDSKNDR